MHRFLAVNLKASSHVQQPPTVYCPSEAGCLADFPPISNSDGGCYSRRMPVIWHPFATSCSLKRLRKLTGAHWLLSRESSNRPLCRESQ